MCACPILLHVHLETRGWRKSGITRPCQRHVNVMCLNVCSVVLYIVPSSSCYVRLAGQLTRAMRNVSLQEDLCACTDVVVGLRSARVALTVQRLLSFGACKALSSNAATAASLRDLLLSLLCLTLFVGTCLLLYLVPAPPWLTELSLNKPISETATVQNSLMYA